MMNVYGIPLGYRNSWATPWLIESGGRWIVVDTGRARTTARFLAGLETAGCGARNIVLIVLTHAHFDHAGAAAALKALSGAPVAAHRREAEILRAGAFVLSDGLNGLGRVKAFLGRHAAPRSTFAFAPVEPDILIDGERRLDDLGFAAALIHTPGHSEGSVSLLFDDGSLFAGDLAINQPLPGLWRHMPLYGTSVDEIKRTWRALIERGARHIYPGHGRSFSALELKRFL